MSTWIRIVLAGFTVARRGFDSCPGGGPDRQRWQREPYSARSRPRSQRFGAGYRYPQAGWIVLHIEGEPYDRGYQHGRLMAPEIAGFVGEIARYRSTKAPADAWHRPAHCWPMPSSCADSTPNTLRR